MPFILPNLDDKTFDGLVTEARATIPVVCPAWTNQNPSDPGIALIELLAWLTEMVIYRNNQITQATSSGFLQLLRGPDPVLTVSAATNASPIVITTTVPHGFVTGDQVIIAGVAGNAAANSANNTSGGGTWTVVVPPGPFPTTFALMDAHGNPSKGSGDYTSGGTALLTLANSIAVHGLDAVTTATVKNLRRLYRAATTKDYEELALFEWPKTQIVSQQIPGIVPLKRALCLGETSFGPAVTADETLALRVNTDIVPGTSVGAETTFRLTATLVSPDPALPGPVLDVTNTATWTSSTFVANPTSSSSSGNTTVLAGTWTPSNFVAHVSNGVVTASAPGTARIQASLGTVSTQALLAVDNPLVAQPLLSSTTSNANFALMEITITPETMSLDIGRTASFTATGTFEDGSKLDITRAVTWSTQTGEILTVDSTGIPHVSWGTLAAGGPSYIPGNTVTIKADLDGKSASAVVTLATLLLETVVVTPGSAKLPVGSRRRIFALGQYQDGSVVDLTESVIWSSNKTSVAVVSTDQGEAHMIGVGPGLTTINATLVSTLSAGSTSSSTSSSSTSTTTASEWSGAASIDVIPAAMVRLEITPASPRLPVGASLTFHAMATYADGSVVDVTPSVVWSTPANGVGQIQLSASGNIGQATAAGQTSLTAKHFNGHSATTSITVTTAQLSSIAIVPPLTAAPTAPTTPVFPASSWSSAKTGNGTLAISPTSGSASVEQFTYTDTSADVYQNQTFTFQAVATTSTTVNYSYTFSGHHSNYGAYASLTAWVQNGASVTLVPAQAVGDGFFFSGTSSLTVTAGSSFGFTVIGSTQDDNGHLDGTLTVTALSPSAATTIASADTFTISNATNTFPIVITTTTAHGFTTGEEVVIAGVLGNRAANGTWPVTVLSSTTFSLTGATGSGAYAGGPGTASGGVFTISNATSASPIVITTTTAHGFTTGEQVLIAGVHGNDAANGAWAINVLSSTTFSLAGRVGNGSYAGGPGTAAINTFTISNATNTNPIVITTTTAHGFTTGEQVAIAGVLGNSAANGTWTISVLSSTTFSLNSSTGSGAYTGGPGTVADGVYTISNATNANPIVITTTAAHGFTTGEQVLIAGVRGNDAANGTWTITSLSSTTFSLTGSVGNGAYTGGPGTAAGGNFTISNATNASPIVVTTTAAHGFTTGKQVLIAGVLGNSAANGRSTITVLSSTTFSLSGSVGSGAYTGGPGTASISGGTLAQTALSVVSTAGFPPSNGTFVLGPAQQAVSYTSTDATTFYGCTGGSAAFTTGQTVTTGTTVTASGTFTAGGTIPVASTATFPPAGAVMIGTQVVRYTGTTATSFTGCTGGSGSFTVSQAVTPAITVPAGALVQLAAVGTYSDGSTLDISDQVTWATQNTALAWVSPKSAANTKTRITDPGGIVIGKTAGATTVTASSTGLQVVSAALNVGVSSSTLSSLAISPSNPTVFAGKSLPLAAIGTFSDGSTYDLTPLTSWSFSVPSQFASFPPQYGPLYSSSVKPTGVNPALLSTLATGAGSSVDVLASVTYPLTNQFSASGATGTSTTNHTNVYISDVLDIVVTPVNATRAQGEAFPFTALAVFATDAVLDVTDAGVWSSSNTSVATVGSASDRGGLVLNASPHGQHVNLPAISGSPDFTSGFACQAWVYLYNLADGAQILDLGGKILFGIATTGSLPNVTGQLAATIGSGPAVSSATGAVVANKWLHVAVTVLPVSHGSSTSTVRFYVNGVNVDANINGATSGQLLPGTGASCYIGKGTASTYLSATISEVSIWNNPSGQVPTPESIFETLVGNEQYLVGYYKLNHLQPQLTGSPTVADSCTNTTTSTAWVQNTAYAVGQVVINGGNIYTCVTAGTSGNLAPSTMKPALGFGIIDGTVVWTGAAPGARIGDGVIAVDVTGEPLPALATPSTSAGVVNMLKPGRTTITATYGNVSGSVPLTVLAVESLSMVQSSAPEAAPGHVSVIVAPDTGDPNRPWALPSAEMLEAMAEFFYPRRTLTTHLHLTGPSYVPVVIAATIYMLSSTTATNVDQYARAALVAHFHPWTGGRDGNGWPFGQDVHASEIYWVLARLTTPAGAPCVDHVESVCLDGGSPPSDNEHIFLQPHQLVQISAESLVLTLLEPVTVVQGITWEPVNP